MSLLRLSCLGFIYVGLLAAVRAAEPGDGDKQAVDAKTYDLKYKFKPNETLRWKVEHKAIVRTTVSGTTQTAETDTSSVKVWKVMGVSDVTGKSAFEHSVESVRMTQRLTGRKDENYDSTTDKVAPQAFAEAAKSVGVPLSLIKLSAKGVVIERKDRVPQANNDALFTVPLPEEAVPIGHEWNVPAEVQVNLPGGQVKKIQTRQQYKLEDVKHDIATISIVTVILTPVRDPAIEVQLIQRETSGTVRFDVAAGRIVSQQMDLDKQVVGFSGETSSMHYQTRFTETLLPTVASASKSPPIQGPKLKR